MACASSLATSLPSAQLASNKSSYIGCKITSTAMPSQCRLSQPLKICVKQQMDEIRKMTDDEIDDAVAGLKRELSIMRSRNEMQKYYKPSTYQQMRIKISRLMAVRRERDMERGIRPQNSRKLRRSWQKSVIIQAPFENNAEESFPNLSEGPSCNVSIEGQAELMLKYAASNSWLHGISEVTVAFWNFVMAGEIGIR